MTNLSTDHDHYFDQILESAIVASWASLMRGTASIHIEYDVTPSGALDYLQIWSCITRGHWLLVCEYQRATLESHGSLRFHNGYQSEDLARILKAVIEHPKAFILPQKLDRARLVQIATPTKKESTAAAATVSDVLDRINSAPPEPALA
ncbi:MAG TPA: hypothetical protein VN708_13555 [Terriglobales bacterium]|jgi:hypothetical protein|nr:hypothetical protein [Terriglobales bacterium]HXU16151.1 hypothetical protein [Terriglobales bacterium]